MSSPIARATTQVFIPQETAATKSASALDQLVDLKKAELKKDGLPEAKAGVVAQDTPALPASAVRV